MCSFSCCYKALRGCYCFQSPGKGSNSRSRQADSDTLIMPEIGSYFQLARFAIFHSFSFCLRHFLALSNCWLCLYPAHWWAHFPLISATICPALKIYLETFSLSNYWLCIRLAHRWTHSIPCLIPNWSDLPSSSTLTISRSLPHWASEPGILQMKYILGFNFFKCISTSCRWW